MKDRTLSITSHVGKTSRDKTTYTKRLQELDSEPTVEPRRVFDTSDDEGDYDTTKISTKSRPQSLGTSLNELKKYWVHICVGLVVLYVSIFIFNFSNGMENLKAI